MEYTKLRLCSENANAVFTRKKMCKYNFEYLSASATFTQIKKYIYEKNLIYCYINLQEFVVV